MAKAGNMTWTQAGELPYDDFILLLLTADGEGLAEQEWYKDTYPET